jgi:hypothetical protein
MEDQHTLITVKEDQDTQEHSCMNSWIDKIKNNKSFNNNNHWLKWIILCYFGFSLVLTSFHLGLKMIPTQDIIKLTRTYDPGKNFFLQKRIVPFFLNILD